MTTPWKRRADRARAAAEKARADYLATKAQRPKTDALVNELRRHRELNGWTSAIVDIFGAP